LYSAVFVNSQKPTCVKLSTSDRNCLCLAARVCTDVYNGSSSQSEV